MKKVLSLLLSVIIGFSLCACEGVPAKEEKDTKTLTWFVPGPTPEDLPLVLEKANEIIYKKIGAKLELVFFDTGVYQEKLNRYMSNSKEYDIAFSGFVNPMADAAGMDGILPLDEYLAQYPELKASIPDYVWELVKYDGKIFAIPNYQVMPVAFCASLDKPVIDEIGGIDLEKIKKLDDMEPIFEKMKQYIHEKENKAVYPFNPPREKEAPLRFDYWVDEYVKLDDLLFKQDENGIWQGELMYENDEFKKGVWKLREWYEKGYTRPDVVSSKTNYGTLSSLQAYKPNIITNLLDGDNRYIICVQEPIVNVCQASTVIGKDCKNPELAMKLIYLVNTDKELYNLLTLGIEGVHYEKTGENTFRYIRNENRKNSYWVNAGWKLGNQFNEYIQEGDTADVWERTKEFNDNARKSPFLGFSANKQSIKSELVKIEEIVDAYSSIYLGVEDPDEYYDDFIKKLKAAGADTVVAEYEKQVNAFMANKQNN